MFNFTEEQLEEFNKALKEKLRELLQSQLGQDASTIHTSDIQHVLEAVINENKPLIEERIRNTELQEYDPVLCIQAGELRAMGIQLSERIPDCAWIEKWSIVQGVTEQVDGDKVCYGITFTRPFRWLSVEVQLG